MKEGEPRPIPIGPEVQLMYFCLTCYLTLYENNEDTAMNQAQGDMATWNHVYLGGEHAVYRIERGQGRASVYTAEHGFVEVTNDKPNGKMTDRSYLEDPFDDEGD